MADTAAGLDLVISTGQQRNVRQFVELAACELGIKIVWDREGIDERGFDADAAKLR